MESRIIVIICLLLYLSVTYMNVFIKDVIYI